MFHTQSFHTIQYQATKIHCQRCRLLATVGGGPKPKTRRKGECHVTLDIAPCVIHSFVDVTYRRLTGRQSLDLDDGTTMKAAGHRDEGARKVATCITSQPTSLTAALIRGVSPHPVPPTIPLVPRVRKVTGQGSLRSRNVRDSRCLPGGGDFKPSASFYCLQSAARGGRVRYLQGQVSPTALPLLLLLLHARRCCRLLLACSP